MTVEVTPRNRIEDLETLELKLAQLRDELRLKAHLARADARDRLDELEPRWQRFRSRVGDLRHGAGDASETLRRTVEKLGTELTEGYEKLRRAI